MKTVKDQETETTTVVVAAPEHNSIAYIRWYAADGRIVAGTYLFGDIPDSEESVSK